MRPSKTFNPERSYTVKKTYYQTRGRTHLLNERTDNPELRRTWCGLDLGDINNYTQEEQDCTCQRCFMHKTKTWGDVVRGRK